MKYLLKIKRFFSSVKTVCNEILEATPKTIAQSFMLFTKHSSTDRDAIFKLRSGITVHFDPQTLDLMVIREHLVNNLYSKFVSGNNNKHLGTVVDLGSHKGFFPLGLLKSGFTIDKYIGVDPLAENEVKFLQNKALNINIFNKIKDFHIERCAICAKEGRFTFYVTKNSVNHSLIDPSGADEIIEKREVPGVTLKMIFEKYNLSQIDVLKIDIEGEEYELFFSDQREFLFKAKTIIMEIHKSQKWTEEDILNVLRQGGYKIFFPNDAYTDLICAKK